MAGFFYTSESVSEGHPDKMADQISDSVLDAIMEKDPMARVACETALTTGLCLIMGEITTHCYVEIPKVARRTIREIGYTDPEFGLDGNTCAVLIALDEQSQDIAMGVDKALETRDTKDEDEIARVGAGDQGMMIGYASNETKAYMPAPIWYAHQLARRLTELRKRGTLTYFRPDGKTQVTFWYEDGLPKYIENVVISQQHDPSISLATLKEDITTQVIRHILPPEYLTDKTRFFINPTGRFVTGGPHGDSGLTGRKIIVDTYGGMASHGGGAFSGKDCTKVDRSGAYMARWVAKNCVAAGLADRLEIQVAYAIGVAKPLSIRVQSFGTGKLSDEKILEVIQRHFDFRPGAIIHELNLRRPIYRQTAAYGHFGRTDLDLPWEALTKVEALRADAGL